MAKIAKQRIDRLLVARGLAESRARAQALVAAGQVYSGDRRIDKPGASLAADAPLAVTGQDHPWVSRGGLKLAHALDHFAIDPQDLVCLDIGASTGGFTDVLLARGAARSACALPGSSAAPGLHAMCRGCARAPASPRTRTPAHGARASSAHARGR